MTRVKSIETFDLRFKNSEARVNPSKNTRTTTDHFHFSNDFGVRKRGNPLKIKDGVFFCKVEQIETYRLGYCPCQIQAICSWAKLRKRN